MENCGRLMCGHSLATWPFGIFGRVAAYMSVDLGCMVDLADLDVWFVMVPNWDVRGAIHTFLAWEYWAYPVNNPEFCLIFLTRDV